MKITEADCPCVATCKWITCSDNNMSEYFSNEQGELVYLKFKKSGIAPRHRVFRSGTLNRSTSNNYDSVNDCYDFGPFRNFRYCENTYFRVVKINYKVPQILHDLDAVNTSIGHRGFISKLLQLDHNTLLKHVSKLSPDNSYDEKDYQYLLVEYLTLINNFYKIHKETF
jgi:hypothetical protein